MVSIGNDWDGILADEFKKPYYAELRRFLKAEYGSRVIYPSMYDIFNAFRYTAYGDVKVVLLGQDPYHGAGQAHGLCFSVKDGVAPPPSLVNIFKELHNDVGCHAVKQRSYRPRRRGGFSPRKGLGNIHRFGYFATQRPQSAYCVHVVGQLCKEQDSADHI